MQSVQREQFMSDQPPARIIGCETEHLTENLSEYRDQLAAAAYQEGLVPRKNQLGFCTNGGRLYRDGDCLEYASAEALGPFHAAAADHAGIAIVQSVWQQTDDNAALSRRSGRAGVDTDGRIITKSQGYHENYLVPSARNNGQPSYFGDVVLSHIVSRIVHSGTGFVGEQFSLSQKAAGTGGGLVYDSKKFAKDHGRKTAVVMHEDTKASNKMNQPGFSRLEIRYSDPAISPSATARNLAISSLMLRLIEQRAITADTADSFIFTQPEHIIADTANKGVAVLSRQYETRTGGHESMASMQRRFAEAAFLLCERIELPADERDGAYQWLDVLDRLDQSDIEGGQFDPLFGTVEWATKYRIIERKFGAAALHAPTRDVINYDTALTILRPGWTPHPADKNEALQDLITKYQTAAPPTRAAARAEILQHTAPTHINWSKVVVPTPGAQLVYEMSDPYSQEIPEPVISLVA